MLIVILTIDLPDNRERVKKLQKQLVKHGYKEGYVFMGKKAKNKEERLDVIFEAHRNICELFLQTKPCKYLFILEDDAHICDKDASVKTVKYIRRLEYINRAWKVLSLGCIATTSMENVSDSLCLGGGIGSHAYILNGRYIERIIHTIPKRKWAYPYAVELWNGLSSRNVYMIHPMLFSQKMHIWRFLPKFTDEKYWYKYANIINHINLWRYQLLIILFILSVISSRRTRKISISIAILIITIGCVNQLYMENRRLNLPIIKEKVNNQKQKDE